MNTRIVLAAVIVFSTLASSEALAQDALLVDCSQKRFKSGSKAESLLGWSNNYFKEASKARAAKTAPPEHVCAQLIDLRGDAYCQSPKSSTYRDALRAALEMCPLPKEKEPPAKEKEEKKPAATAVAKPMVDCSEKRFQNKVSVRGLMSFSDVGMRDIRNEVGTGIYPKSRCEKVISERGSAHCQELGSLDIRKKLQESIDLCHSLEFPAASKKAMLVDCKLPRFSKKSPVPEMVKWSVNMTSKLSDWNPVAAKAKCEEAYSFAGSAHCRLPTDDKARQAVKQVAESCAQDQERRAGEKLASAEAEKKRIAQQKANRVIGKLPTSTYRGAGKLSLSKQMRKALVAGRIAKTAREISKVYPMGAWKSGRFTDTKLQFKKITGLVLWADDDKDGVCRYTSYNFVKIRKKSWGALSFKSFCLGCAEGWTRCK